MVIVVPVDAVTKNSAVGGHFRKLLMGRGNTLWWSIPVALLKLSESLQYVKIDAV